MPLNEETRERVYVPKNLYVIGTMLLTDRSSSSIHVNYEWTPGYWAYTSGGGYYWTPGVWVTTGGTAADVLPEFLPGFSRFL